jgi:hypothetical protein
MTACIYILTKNLKIAGVYDWFKVALHYSVGICDVHSKHTSMNDIINYSNLVDFYKAPFFSETFLGWFVGHNWNAYMRLPAINKKDFKYKYKQAYFWFERYQICRDAIDFSIRKFILYYIKYIAKRYAESLIALHSGFVDPHGFKPKIKPKISVLDRKWIDISDLYWDLCALTWNIDNCPDRQTRDQIRSDAIHYGLRFRDNTRFLTHDTYKTYNTFCSQILDATNSDITSDILRKMESKLNTCEFLDGYKHECGSEILYTYLKDLSWLYHISSYAGGDRYEATKEFGRIVNKTLRGTSP